MGSAIAAITQRRFNFRLFPGTIRSPQVVEFLRHLLRHVPGRLLIIWDGLAAHRSRVVRESVEDQDGQITWGHGKHHELPNP